MLRIDSLPAETARLFSHLGEDPDIGRFTLVGGTALTLSFAHRRSEDLDFAFAGLNLPRAECAAIVDRLQARGWRLQDVSDPDARLYRENEGDDLADSQQDWLCRFQDAAAGVKLTFFAEFLPAKQRFYAETAAISARNINVMAPAGLFVLKSQLLLRRTTLRDIFDVLAFLVRGRTVEEVLEAAQAENRHCTYETIRARLLPARLPATDPGLAGLVADGPRTLDAVKAAVQVHVDACERRLAAAVFDEDPARPEIP
jgi:hypothetical protein